MPWPTYASMKIRVCTGCGERRPTRYGVCNECYDLPSHKRPNSVARRAARRQVRPPRPLPVRRGPRDALVCGCDYMLADLEDKGHSASECPTPKWVRV